MSESISGTATETSTATGTSRATAGTLPRKSVRRRAVPFDPRRTAVRRSKRRREKSSSPADLAIPPGGNRSFSYQIVKRIVDVVGAIVLLTLFSPIMLATVLVLVVTTRGRPLFVQERLGRSGRPFRLLKFRTMIPNALAMKHLVPNEIPGPAFKNSSDPRVTRVGQWLRSFSIDETPQLFNVLWGHMSLVGPRPPLAEEVANYQPWQRRRLAVKPGLTCLWQVSGRSEIGFEQWMKMDIWYLEHQSLLTDLILLWQTPASVLSRRGAY